MSSLLVTTIDPADPAAVRLIEESDAYMSARYPAASNHLESVAALKQPNVTLLGGFLGEELVACGAVKIMDDDAVYGEIKRVLVTERCRGRGFSKAIMLRLEDVLRGADVPLARLETGIRQPEALRLYESLGYSYRGPFGHYRLDPLSVFMEKALRCARR